MGLVKSGKSVNDLGMRSDEAEGKTELPTGGLAARTLATLATFCSLNCHATWVDMGQIVETERMQVQTSWKLVLVRQVLHDSIQNHDRRVISRTWQRMSTPIW